MREGNRRHACKLHAFPYAFVVQTKATIMKKHSGIRCTNEADLAGRAAVLYKLKTLVGRNNGRVARYVSLEPKNANLAIFWAIGSKFGNYSTQ